MKNCLLKNALFGYSKLSVCEYIASVNEEFSQKLLQEAAEYKKDKEELKAKIAALEEELVQYRKAHSDVATVLFEAQQYADILKRQAEAENNRVCAELAEQHKAQTEKLTAYAAAIAELRENLKAFVEETDEKLLVYMQRGSEIVEAFKE
ncbi:MAG: DivIVA domain-containing protein [Clostridia bacterium]|nr:DivIVA domain-containing protein [Clostridia bacterium]